MDAALLALLAVTAIAELTYHLTYNTYFAMLGTPSIAAIRSPRGRPSSPCSASPRPCWDLGPVDPGTALGLRGDRRGPGPGRPAPAGPAQHGGDPHAPGALRAARLAFAMIVVDGWFDACYFFVWEIALFLSLGESIAAYGGAMALAGLVGAGFGLWVGRHVDGGGGRRAVAIAYCVAVALVILKAASLPTPGWPSPPTRSAPCSCPAAAAARRRGLQPRQGVPCPFRFHMATEGGWDIGCAGACVTAAGLVSLGPR
uniref:Uncharacterized protein n=1 Tax=Phenylobacterium glaciei TaxID=2803784 RepID=A0A974P6Y9_9CAUL|nr:hypothetical protein JKL49_13095 [Phenylobacterium glaciei]